MAVCIIFGTIVIVLAFLIICVVHMYNKLVKARNRVSTQWSQIDVQLNRRADLLPNLVETVQGYASHEKEIFDKISVARNALGNAPSPEQAFSANDQLSGQLVRLFALAESYPDLKADNNFIHLQASLKETEDKIAYARQFYNDSVLIYKDMVHQFPSNVVAKLFRFKDEVSYLSFDGAKDNLEIAL